MTRTPARVTQADVARARESGHTFIYFLRSGEFVKIGQSADWRQRIAQMQVGSPHIIVTLLILMDEPNLEKKLHRRFKSQHFRGEWFYGGGAISAFVKDNLHRCVANMESFDLRPMKRKIIL